MSDLFLGAAVAMVGAALLHIYRVAAGPTVFDRLVGLGGVATKTIVVLLLIGALYGRVDMVVDIVLGAALVNFLASLAAAKYFHDGDPYA